MMTEFTEYKAMGFFYVKSKASAKFARLHGGTARTLEEIIHNVTAVSEKFSLITTHD